MQPTIEDLECLIMWPKGTAGYWTERAVLNDLLRLCKEHGFGRVPQLAQQIEEIWRGGEESIAKGKEVKRKHFAKMKEGWKEAFGEKPCLYTDENM